ncbi:MAG: hypothetical protein OXB84_08435 [Halobacteriovoraceae bacterium]|nr:hypothetical protein [Halobacteriovoraceae bacterium]
MYKIRLLFVFFSGFLFISFIFSFFCWDYFEGYVSCPEKKISSSVFTLLIFIVGGIPGGVGYFIGILGKKFKINNNCNVMLWVVPFSGGLMLGIFYLATINFFEKLPGRVGYIIFPIYILIGFVFSKITNRLLIRSSKKDFAWVPFLINTSSIITFCSILGMLAWAILFE